LKISKTMRDLKAVKMQNLSIRIPVKCFTGLVTEIHSRPADQTTEQFKSLKTGKCIYKKKISHLKENTVRVHYKYLRVNAVQWHDRSSFRESIVTQVHYVAKCQVL